MGCCLLNLRLSKPPILKCFHKNLSASVEFFLNFLATLVNLLLRLSPSPANCRSSLLPLPSREREINFHYFTFPLVPPSLEGRGKLTSTTSPSLLCPPPWRGGGRGRVLTIPSLSVYLSDHYPHPQTAEAVCSLSLEGRGRLTFTRSFLRLRRLTKRVPLTAACF